MFTLAVGNFGVQYIDKEHADHLIEVLNKHYEFSEDWEGENTVD